MKNKILKSSASLAALGFVAYSNYYIDVDEFTVPSKKIPKEFDGFRILQLSDFHNKNFGFGNRHLLSQINKTHPDIILMTGDMVSREDRHYKNFYRLAEAIGKKYEVYYTIGNHELDLPDAELQGMFFKLREYGITIVNNEKIRIFRHRAEIDLYGMWYGLRYYKDNNGNYRNHLDFDQDEITRLLGKKNSENFTMLMAHNPLVFNVYADWGADLTFSGHVHGGVIRLGLLGGLFSPGRRIFPKYYAGEYYLNNKRLIVSRGIGGLRLLNRPNLVVAVLKNTK